MAIVMLIPNDFDTLLQYYSFATVSYYWATCVALLWFRYKMPDKARPVKVSISIIDVCKLVHLLYQFFLVHSARILFIVHSLQLALFGQTLP